MRNSGWQKSAPDRGRGQLPLLLAAFLAGVLLARFVPAVSEVFPGESRFWPALFAGLALLAGSVPGVWLIPVISLAAGSAVMLRVTAAVSAGAGELTAVLPGLLLPAGMTAAFFPLAFGGMRLAEECLDALRRSGSAAFSLFLPRQLILSFAACAVAVVSCCNL